MALSCDAGLVTVALALAVVAVGSPRPARAEPPAASMNRESPERAPADSLSELDALHARRDDPAARERARGLVNALLAKAPNDYQVLWRAARVLFTESDDDHRSKDERGRIGKEAWEVAQRAVAVSPGSVEGYYWGALSVGSYGSTLGILGAISNGIEGKFKRMLERAAAVDLRYDHGGIPVTWAAYYLELPWPKRDRKKAAEECHRALTLNPANLRARLYLARVAEAEDRPDEARARLDEIAAARADRYDPPEERAVKREAATMRAKLH